jgi:hypothetical protein
VNSLRTTDARNAYKIPVVQPDGREYKECSSNGLSCGDVDCLYVAQDRHERQAFVIVVMNVRVPQQAGNLLIR